MSRLIEDRLRDAYQAKTAQLTEGRLDQLTASREHGLDGLFGPEFATERTAELPLLDFDKARRTRRHRWIAPALAAAAVAAVAIGAVVVATDRLDSRPKPNPLASHVSSPPASSSAPIPTPSASATQTVVAPPYLPAGQTGSRDQVPWSIVGSGWRLLQPRSNTGSFDRSIYLYDPAGGRYLLTDRLPEDSELLAWSPDGQRAMVRTLRDSRFRQFDLRTGSVVSTAVLPGAGFIAYTTPRGLAMLVVTENTPPSVRIQRYSTDGALELTYSDPSLIAPLLYTPDGTRLVGETGNGPVLLGNDGRLIRQFPAPTGYSGCSVIKWWTSSSVLEGCYRQDPLVLALFLQPLSGSPPSVLVDSAGPNHEGYANAWQLSNGDILLQMGVGCAFGGYEILTPRSGSIRPLKGPPGVTKPGRIANMDGDLATFQQQNYSATCGAPDQPRFSMIDYNMVTGQTRKLIDGLAVLVNWPGDGR
jgi:hypothetical protein